MSELKVGIAFRLIDAITEPLQKLTERLGAVTKATKAVSGGMTGVGKASAQINKASSAIVKADAVTGEWNKTTSLLVDQFGNALPSVTAGVDKVGEAVDTVADKIALLGGMDNRAAGTQVAQLAQNAGVADFDALSKIVVGGAHASGTDIGETLASLTTLAKQGEGLGFKGADDLADISKLKAAFAIGGSENSEGAVSAILSNLPRLGEKMQHGKGWRVMDTAATMQRFGIGNLMDQAFDKEGNLLADESGSKMGNINKIIHAISTAKDAGGNAIGDKDKLNIFRELFDQNAAIDLAKMDLGLLNEATAKLLEQADVQAKVAAVTDTTASKFQELKNSVSGSIGKIGQTLLPITGEIMDRLSGIVTAISDWVGEHPKLAGAMAIVAGVLGSLLVVVGGGITIFGMLGQSLFWAQKAMLFMGPNLALLSGGFMSAASGAWAFASALLANPITWIVLAIAGAAFLIYKFWDPIKTFFIGVWNTIADSFKAVWNWFKGAGPIVDILLWVFMPFVALPLLIMKHWDKIKGFFVATWDWLVGLWNKVPGWMQWFFPLIKIPLLIIENWGKVKDFFKGIGDWISKPFKSKEVKAVVDAAAGPEIPQPEVPGIKGAAAVKDKKKGVFDIGMNDAEMEKMLGGKFDSKIDFSAQVMAPSKDKSNKKSETRGGDIVIHYEPKIEFKGDVKDADKDWFKKQLQSHKDEIAKIVKDVFDRERRWMGAT